MDVINRTTLRGKLANSNRIRFQTYEDYERMQGLIDSCAKLRIVPVAWMESWANMQESPVDYLKIIKKMVSDWEEIDEACRFSETDFEGEYKLANFK